MNRFECKISTQDADIHTTTLTAEWRLFKSMFEKCLSYHSKVDRDISRAHRENVQERIKKRESYTPQKLWDDLKHDNVVKEIYPNCIYQLHLLLIFPISIACVERLFSQMKLVKMRFRNQLKQTTLNFLLHICHRINTQWFYQWRFQSFC